MKRLYLIENTEEPAGIAKDAQLAAWDRGRVPAGWVSIPAELNRRLLTIRDELAAWTLDFGLQDHHGKPLERYLRAGDPLSMWWLSTLFEKHPKVTHNLFPALKLRALECYMDEQGIGELTLVAPKKATPWLESVLKKFCSETGRTFSRIEGAPRKSLPKPTLKERLIALYHRLPAPIQALGRFPAWLWLVRRHLPQTTLARPRTGNLKPATIVTYFPNIDMAMAAKGRFRSRYWEKLHDVLAPQEGQPHRVNWVFLYYPAPQCSFREAIRLRDAFRASGKDGASFHFLEEFLTTGDIAAALWRFLRLSFAGMDVQPCAKRHFHFAGSHMDLWPVLRDNWADSTRGWRALERCLMRKAFIRYAAWAGPQDWTTFPQENCPWERMLAQSMHEANAGPVWGAQHSTVRPTDFRYFDDPRQFTEPSTRQAMLDLWLCNGTGAQNGLLGGGMPASRTELVEALRYLYLAPTTTQDSTDNAKPNKLLVVTSFFADETDAHLATLADAIKSGVLEGWTIQVKPHPYLPVAERLARLCGTMAPDVVDGPIGNYLQPGSVVWASNSTTVSLEAAYKGLPVLVQAAEDDVDLCPLQGLPGVSIVRTAEDVASALADPRAPELPENYLALDPDLPRWKARLGLEEKPA